MLRVLNLLVRLAGVLARLLQPASWRAFLTRGDHFIVAFGRLYMPSRLETRAFRNRLVETFGGPGRNGRLFVRWPNPRRGRRERPDIVPTLLVSGLGRFGNSIIQLANAVRLAVHVQTPNIIFFPSAVVRLRNLGAPSRVGLRQHTVVPQANFAAPSALWRSDFIEGWPNSPLLEQAVVDTFRADIFPSLNVPPVTEGQAATVLTIHLRSGDVYGENPHPGYGQPPLSFYEAVIRHDSWSEIRLVSEDQESPLWEALLTACREREIPLRVLGRTLDEALTEVASSSNLVASRGTFVPALLFLFPKKRRVFYFGQDFELLNSGAEVELVQCEDIGEQFTQSNLARNWKNSARQRDLMLTYPANLLKISARPR